MNDAFDPDRFKLPPEIAAELAQAKPKQKTKRQRRTEPFLQIPHKALVTGAEVLGGQHLLVWLYIHRQHAVNTAAAAILWIGP